MIANMTPLDEQKLERAMGVLSSHADIRAAFLHGSAVKGVFRKDSDIDIAILMKPDTTLSVRDRLELAGGIEFAMGRSVDLGILSTYNLVYARQVIEHGRLLFTKDKFYSDLFVATCLAMYIDFQIDRQEVLRAYSC